MIVVLILVSLVTCASSIASLKLGYRWLQPMLHVLHDRLAANPNAVDFFQKNGMPIRDTKLASTRYLNQTAELYYAGSTVVASEKIWKTEREGDVIFNQWINDHANGVYVKYIMTHPRDAFFPLVDQGGVFWKTYLCMSGLTDYYYLFYPHIPVNFFAQTLNEIACWFPFVLLAFSFFFAVKNSAVICKDKIVWLCIYLLGANFILAFMIFHADTYEIMRHQLVTYLWLVIALAVLLIRVALPNQK